MKFVFFGSSQFSVLVLEELKNVDLEPHLLVTIPDKPKGRKLLLSPNGAKRWALDNDLNFTEFESLKNFSRNQNKADPVKIFNQETWDFFLVASYGKMIPSSVFEIPKHKTLNIHPSLLPKYRGASPIKSQILNDENPVGVSIIVVDEGIDTGPIIAKKELNVPNWPVSSHQLEKILAKESVLLFASIIDKWIGGEIEVKPQSEKGVSICHKIKKEDGLIDLSGDARKNLLKIKAFSDWPRTYYITNRGDKKIRVIITDAKLDESKNLQILKVIPEGKKEMDYDDFLRGNR